MLYFSCMPLVFILSFLSMLLFYWVAKYKLIRLDKKPPIYAHSISELSINIIYIGLALNSLVSPLYYGNIYDNNDSLWIDRYITYWYYTLNFFVLVLYGLFRVRLANLYYCWKHKFLDCLSEGQ